MASCWRHCFCLHFLILAVFQTPTQAYISVDLAFHCLPEGPPSVLRLQSEGPRSAAFVELNVRSPHTPTTYRESGTARCRLDVTAPLGHELTVHLDHPKEFFPSRSSEERQGFLPCFLELSQADKASDGTETLHKEAVRIFDLCNDSKMAPSTLFMTNRLTLAWAPPEASLAGNMVAKRLVITAVGRNADVCNTRHRFLCTEGCISAELACDGYNNCPLAAEDEDPADCEAVALKGGLFLRYLGSSEEARQSNPHNFIETILTKAVLKSLTKDKSGKRDVTSTMTSKPGQNKQSGFELTSGIFRYVSDIILKKLLSKDKSVQVTEPRNLTMMTTTIKPPLSDDLQDPTLPAALAHYGPWGYLMLGMLICGAILMLCGLWECCCRSSKHRLPAGGPASTSASTTVFIINSAGIGSHRRNSATQQDEAPPTPGPPSYEELDQPPSYSALFPMTKIPNMESLTTEENSVISGQRI